MILIKLILLPIRIVLWAVGAVIKINYKTVRFIGLRRIFTLLVGAVLGALATPYTGAEARAKLQELIDGQSGGATLGGDDLAERVRFELSHSPRTWHLPQPNVSVIGGTVTLTGSVPHDAGRDELEAQAGAVPGVLRVENLVTVEAEDGVEAASSSLAEAADEEE